MTRPDDLRLDDQLAALLQDAVVDIDPQDRFGELQAQTASAGTSRRWWVATGGAALATAATITAIALVLDNPSPTATPGPTTTPSGSVAEETPTGPVSAVPAYFVGDTPRGPRLYREFQPVSSPTAGLAGLELLESGALDPDYASLWPEGSFTTISDPEDGGVRVRLGDGAPADPSDLAVQQVIYTLSAGFQEPLWVVFDRGQTQTDPVSAAPRLEVLSLVSLSDPVEGQVVGDTLVVRGVANSSEANVLWTIEGSDAGMGSYLTASDWMGERLFPFSGEIDVSSLDPGTYTLIVETDDPSGGAEGGPGVFSDTRTFVVERP